jgi:putative aldouronate transport system substrate-binding protein
MKIAAGAAMVAGMPWLAACGGDEKSADSGDTGSPTGSVQASTATSGAATASPSSQAGKSVLPAYVPYAGVKPDLPAAGPGALDGFLSYPDNPPVTIPVPPGKGESFSALTQLLNVSPSPFEKNKSWQALNKALGIDLKYTFAPPAQYSAKVATTIAGDVPDVMALGQNVPRMADVLEAKFQDLTEYLAGDAIKEYPFLANIPEISWKSAMFNGKLYCVPSLNRLIPGQMLIRKDIAESKQLDYKVDSAAAFTELCKAIADPKKGKYAILGNGPITFALQMCGAPNGWANDGGKFTASVETDEYKRALDYVAGLWKSGACYPDTFAGSVNINQLFGTGTCALTNGGGIVYEGYMDDYAPTTPGFALDFIAPPKFDGGGLAGVYQGNGVATLTGLKKANPDRIRALLKVMNYLAAPFGTSEYLMVTFGVKDVDYTWDEQTKSPRVTQQGNAELLPLRYVVRPPMVLYSPGYPEATQSAYAYEKTIFADSVPLPTVGLASSTDQEKGASLQAPLTSLQNEIIQGRKPVSAWDAAVRSWRQAGGDTVRAEYQTAYQQSGGQ